jgi:PAS domain S-box-containing protein
MEKPGMKAAPQSSSIFPQQQHSCAKCASLVAAVEQAADSFVMTDCDGRILYVNPAFTAMTGYASREVVGQNPRILKSGHHSRAFYEQMWSTIRSGQVWQGVVTNRRKDGEFYDEEMQIAPVRDLNGATMGYVAIKHDVTERRKAEETQAFLAAIVDNSEDSIISSSPEGKIITFNRGAEAIFGYTAGEVIGRHMSMLVPPERVAGLERLAEILRQGGTFSQYEGFCQNKSGQVIPASVTGFPIKNSAGEIIAISNILRDITGRKKAEQALRESEDRFRVMADGCPTPMWVTDAEGGIQFTNRTFREFCGVPHESVEGQQWRLLIHPDDMQEFAGETARAVRTHTTFKAEARVRRADGEWRWLIAQTEPRFSTSGRFLGHVGLSTDITERKQAEQALQASEEKFRQLAENIRQFFWLKDPAADGFLYLSPAYEQIWERSCASVYQNPATRLEAIHPEDLERSRSDFARQMRGEEIETEYRIRTPDGREKWIRGRTFPIRDPDGQLLRVAGIAEDITEYKHHEEALIRAQAEAEAANRQLAAEHVILDNERIILRAFIDNVPDLMYVKDVESRFVVANPSVARWMGAENPGDLLGKTDFDFYPRELAARFFADEQKIIHSRQPLFDQEESSTSAANEPRLLLTTKVPLLDSEGRVTGIAGIGREITERKKAEDALHKSNQDLQEATDRANKLTVEANQANAAKSAFLANMSHEIRTPMNGILGMTGLLLDSALSVEQRHFAEVVDASARSLLTVIDDILDFSKVEAGKLEIDSVDFNLHSLMSDFSEIMAEQARNRPIEFVCAVPPDVSANLKGDPGRLRQVLQNLVSNAIKFTHHGEVVLRVERISESESDAWLRFSVRDTGIGIPLNKQQTLFTSFTQVDASTTRKYGGTGLGLAISRKLVELMGGEIGLESQEGVGSAFWFTLHFARQQESARRNAPEVPVKGARILVVDDNATNREVLTAQLQSWGAAVVARESGPEALVCLRNAAAAGAPFHVAVLDGLMPGMDGAALGRAIQKDDDLKTIPLVMMTSLGRRGDARHFKEIGFAAYLPKPVRQSDLFDCLVTLLGGSCQAETQPLITRHSLRAARRSNARILLVEDNLTNQEVACGILRRLGWRADVAGDGNEALRLLEQTPYDLVLMDVQMPGMDGYEATQRIRDPHSAVLKHDVPIIATTAHAITGDAAKCLAAGMSDYVAKPIDPQTLEKQVEKWLARKVHEAHSAPPAGSPEEAGPPQPASPISLPVFDREAFLGRMMGDEQFAHEVVAEFVKETPALIQTLAECVARGDLESIWKLAHKIKGSAANVGGESLRDAALKMEQAGKVGDRPEILKQIPNLESEAGRLIEALRQSQTEIGLPDRRSNLELSR